MSLLQLLIGAGLAVFAVMVAVTAYDQQRLHAEKIALETERIALHRAIARGVDCDLTLNPSRKAPMPIPPPGCTSLSLRGIDGRPLGHKFDKWEIQAKCLTSGADRGLDIRIGKKTAKGTWALDPISGMPLDFNHPASPLLASRSLFCAKYFFPSRPTSRFENGLLIKANTCGGKEHLKLDLCNGPFFTDIKFKKPFTTPPAVFIIPDTAKQDHTRKGWCNNIEKTPPCTTGFGCISGADQWVARATNVTKTGFRLYCSASPPNTSWDGEPGTGWFNSNNTNCATSTHWQRGTCSWFAYGI